MIETVAQSPLGPIEAVDISGGGLRARILTIGAAVQSLHLDGVAHPLVIGFDNPLDYLDNPAYVGVVVGRVANRISGARIEWEGARIALDANERGTVTLHGGREGSSRRLWQIVEHGSDFVTLSDTLPDGHMGFPGDLTLTVTYRLRDGALGVIRSGKTTTATLCNPAPHLYFNLDGAPTIDAHLLQINAARMIPVEAGLPIGQPCPAEPDLRRAQPVPEGLDHHYCVADGPGPMQRVARLSAGRLRLDLYSTEPGLQVYDGAALPRLKGTHGMLGPRAGVAIEPHRWIDAPNQAWREQVILRAGQTFRAESRFAFTQEPG